MNAAQLFGRFDRISDAPDAIPSLRRFILDLAVRGKLVQQDPKDEPAEILLERIHREQRLLVEEGTLKKPARLPPVEGGELAFPIPHGWQPTRLGVVAACLDYLREPVNSTERERRTQGKKPADLFPYYGATQQQGWIDDFIFDEELLLLGEDGAPFFDELRPKAYLISGRSWVNNHAHVFRALGVSHAFLAHYLNTFNYEGRVAGATRFKLNQAKAIGIPIGLPPVAEQHRIVVKVDELMAQCDKWEAAQTEREERRDRLVVSSVQRLNQPAAGGAPALREHVRFHLRHLPRLTARAEHIRQLRQAILNLAICGQIVPQDPNDEPASKLLERIQAEKEGLIEQREVRRPKQLRMGEGAAHRFDIPERWSWTTLGHLALGLRYGTSVKCSYQHVGAPVLRIPNIANGRIAVDDLKFGSLPAREAEALRLQLGDILMVRSNGSLDLVGRPALVEAHAVGYCYAGYLVRVRTTSAHLDARYLLLALNSPFVRCQIEIPIRTTVGLKNVNASELGALTVPLPPINEQHRIVAKVAELMAVCDLLETQVNIARRESRHLLGAALHQALGPAA